MEQIIGVFADYSQKEFASEQKAVEAGCQYIFGPWKNRATWRNGSQRTIPVRELHSPHGKVVGAMVEGRWKLHDLYLHGSGWIVDHTFEDPNGELKRLPFGPPDGPLSYQLRALVSTLQELSGFNSWNEYDLTRQIRVLTQENEKLVAQVKDLEAKLANSAPPEEAA